MLSSYKPINFNFSKFSSKCTSFYLNPAFSFCLIIKIDLHNVFFLNENISSKYHS